MAAMIATTPYIYKYDADFRHILARWIIEDSYVSCKFNQYSYNTQTLFDLFSPTTKKSS